MANSQGRELREYSFSGELIRKIELGGYTRGLCIDKEKIYIGLSCSRNNKDDSMSSASVVAITRDNWDEVGRIHLSTKEIYSIVKVENKEFMVEILLHHFSNLNEKNRSLVKQKICTDNENQILKKRISQIDEEVWMLSSELNFPPSEKESGVTLRIPITCGRSKTSVLLCAFNIMKGGS